MQMIMSTIPRAADRRADAGSPQLTDFAAAAKGVWRAYVRRRMEQTAIILLRSMSDQDLEDMGLARSDIESAVGGRRSREDGGR
jgi:uncharacterized protein YjiS (DUF1127 family)